MKLNLHFKLEQIAQSTVMFKRELPEQFKRNFFTMNREERLKLET